MVVPAGARVNTRDPQQPLAGKPKISIIIPCYNYGRFLAEAVDSALAQTWKADEILIVDDGSTDMTAAVAERYKDQPGMNIIHQQNQGAIATYNNGIQASTGTFFLILSADDRLDPRYLERTVPMLRAQPRLGYVYTAYRMFSNTQRALPALPYNAALLRKRPYITATALMRRAAYDQCGGFSTAMEGGHEDWDFYVTMAQHGWHGVAVPEVLFHYRKHSTTSRNAIPFLTWLGVRARVYRRHRELYPHLPLWLYLTGVVFDQQRLRVKATPQTVLRRIARSRSRQRGQRICLLDAPSSEENPYLRRLRTVVGQHWPVTTITTMHKSAGRERRLPWREHLRLIRAAVYQRAPLYHAFAPAALPAAIVAATINGSIAIYSPDATQLERTRKAGILGRALTVIILRRADAVIAADRESARRLDACFGTPATVIELEGPACAIEGQRDFIQLEEVRLLQLYRDLLEPTATPSNVMTSTG